MVEKDTKKEEEKEITEKEEDFVTQESHKKRKKFKCTCCQEYKGEEHLVSVLVHQKNRPHQYQNVLFNVRAMVDVCSTCVKKWRVGR